MADWKKIIFSGSNAQLNQVTASFFSGSGVSIFGVVSSSYALSASYAPPQISVSSSYALTASYASGGSGSFVGDGSGLTGISAAPAGPNQSVQFNDAGSTSGSSDFLFDKTLKVLKLSGATSINAITASGNLDNYLQINIQNKNTAKTASSDIVATNDTGTEIGNYIDMGINGSGYNQSQFLGRANDGYLYTTGSKLIIGNVTPAIHPSSSIDFVVGGPQSVRMKISSSGEVSASSFIGNGSGLTNLPPVPQNFNKIVTSSYTLQYSDMYKMIINNTGSISTIIIPSSSIANFYTGSNIDVFQMGAGQITFTTSSNFITLVGTPGLKLRAQYSAVSLIKIDTDSWIAIGDLSA